MTDSVTLISEFRKWSAAVISDPKPAKVLDEVPPGHRGLGRCLHETDRAYLFEYYGDEVWIPKKVLVRAEGGMWAPQWAIKSSKERRA